MFAYQTDRTQQNVRIVNHYIIYMQSGDVSSQDRYSLFTFMKDICICVNNSMLHDDVIKWKYFLCYWPFVRGNSPVSGEFPPTKASDAKR